VRSFVSRAVCGSVYCLASSDNVATWYINIYIYILYIVLSKSFVLAKKYYILTVLFIVLLFSSGIAGLLSTIYI